MGLHQMRRSTSQTEVLEPGRQVHSSAGTLSGKRSEFGIHGLASLGQNGDQVIGDLLVARGEEGNGLSLLSGTTSPANAVDVVFDVRTHVVIDDEANILNVCINHT
eukprot:m.161670 g.161670  ORF g.161670 m.161670 type:complete len:106 (+) comp53043_c0_seq5:213-530(+)